MVRHRRGLFERAAVLEISGDPRSPETVVAELGGDAGGSRTPTDHCIGVRLWQRPACQLVGAAPDRAEQRLLGIIPQACTVEIRCQVFLEVVVARHRVPLAAFLPQPHP